MQKHFRYFLVALIALLVNSKANAMESVNSDARIKTFIYGQNDVFRVNSLYGYQTVIEFNQDERIQTISVGNQNIFKIIPQKNRIFLKALQNGQITNMTVITDQYTYQFDISSIVDNDSEMMYVVRFYYPDDLTSDDSYKGNSRPMDIYSRSSMPIVNSESSSTNSLSDIVPKTNEIINDITVNEMAVQRSLQDVPLSMKYKN